jgi:beta-lactamase regulating signal transducer with metallopeptidase domain
MTAALAGSLLGVAVSNSVVALPIALLAWWFQVCGNRPALSHLLWLLVLVKLVTPPLVALSVASLPVGGQAAVSPFDPSSAGAGFAVGPDAAWYAALTWPLALACVWLLGSTIVLAGSLFRAYRFNRLLCQTSAPADAELQLAAVRIANSLGLVRIPEIFATRARISPLVWWIGGAVRVYLPRTIVDRMDRVELDAIVTHELGHVRRGDHFVRWLECAVSILLWWNPLAWWARRNLRVCEEICCDAFVLAKTDSSRDVYAEALVSAMELLATPSLRPSGLASHVNGGFIERRIRMILSGQSILETPRWLRAVVVAAAALVLPLGFSSAQDAGDLDRVQEWLDSGVNSAFLTEEQAEIMMRALRSADGRLAIDTDDANGNIFVMKRQVMADGNEVLLDVDFKGAETADPLAFVARSIAEQVASGQMSQAEADTLLTELENGKLGQLAKDGGTIRVVSVQGEPIEVIAKGPDKLVTVDGGKFDIANAEVVEFTLEREVEHNGD